MKPRPRIRRYLKWGGLVWSVLLAVAWFGSGWISVFAEPMRGWVIGFQYGLITLWVDDRPPPGRYVVGVQASRHPYEVAWVWPRYDTAGDLIVDVPLWLPTALLAGITVIAWRFDTLARRRARTNQCPACGYSRAGIAPEAVCPECGKPAPASPSARASSASV